MTSQSLPLYIVDAFSDQPFGGNPAAVVPLESWPEDQVLQNIAMEHNLSETAFFVPSQDESAKDGAADFEIRWFTPTVEVPLCGHATLASSHVIFQHMGFAKDTLRLKTRERGTLTLTQAGQAGDTAYTMDLPAAEQTATPLDPSMAKSLGLTVLEAYEGGFLMLVLPSAEAVARYQPDFDAIAATGKELIITATGGTAEFADFDFVSRMFAPTIGIDEDPVTGAAHAQLTPYWALTLQKTELKAAQIGPRSGKLTAVMAGNRVQLIGQARTYAMGQIFL